MSRAMARRRSPGDEAMALAIATTIIAPITPDPL
jgi:hypothetical protein